MRATPASPASLAQASERIEQHFDEPLRAVDELRFSDPSMNAFFSRLHIHFSEAAPESAPASMSNQENINVHNKVSVTIHTPILSDASPASIGPSAGRIL